MRARLLFSGRRVAMSCAVVCGALVTPTGSPRAQGCMPIRFTSPNLTLRDNTYLNDHGWQFGAGYRWLDADHFYIGHTYSPLASPGQKPIIIKVHTLNLSATYAFTNRFSAGILVPFVAGSQSMIQGDNLRHTQTDASLGDISLVANMWLLQPLDHATGNISVTVGVKAPTGSHDHTDAFHSASGDVTATPVQTSLQAGDGGWGIVLQTDAFKQISGKLSAYAAGSYLANPRGHSEVASPVSIATFTAVTDEYSAHAGLAYAVAPKKGLAVSLGGRIDGVPVHDAIGGGSLYFRRPGYTIFAEPAVSLTLAKTPFSRSGSTFSLSVPVAVDRNRESSVAEQQHGVRYGGDFASYLIFFNYSIRR